jgi:hypothetical protein
MDPSRNYQSIVDCTEITSDGSKHNKQQQQATTSNNNKAKKRLKEECDESKAMTGS